MNKTLNIWNGDCYRKEREIIIEENAFFFKRLG